MNEQDYWFYIYPNIYISEVSNSILLYNTDTGESLCSQCSIFNFWIHSVYEPENLGVIRLKEEALQDERVADILYEATHKKLVRFIQISQHLLKPINFLPILNLQHDYEVAEKDKAEELKGDNVISYLSKLNLIILSQHEVNETEKRQFMQMDFPVPTVSQKEELDIRQIRKLFNIARFSLLKKVNIWGEGLLTYQSITELIEVFSDYSDYRFHLWYICKEDEEMSLLEHISLYYDFIIFPRQNSDLQKIKRKLAALNIQKERMVLYAYITSMQEIYHCENLFHDYKIYIRPLYDGSNLDFFEKNVFLQKEDILFPPVSMNTIFCNQKINSQTFGMLTIYPNGIVKAGFSDSSAGNLYHKDVREIIYKELISGTNWRNIRSNDICNKCCYRFLCPPPSKYEKALGRPNLCLMEE